MNSAGIAEATKRKVHAMSKTTAEKTTEAEFGTFNASKAAGQAQEGFEKVKSSADDARQAFEKTFESAQAVSNEFALKSLSMVRDGAEATLAQFEALAGAKTFSEVVELQSSYVRKQMEFATRQAKEFQSLSEKALTDFTQPLRDAFSNSFKH